MPPHPRVPNGLLPVMERGTDGAKPRDTARHGVHASRGLHITFNARGGRILIRAFHLHFKGGLGLAWMVIFEP